MLDRLIDYTVLGCCIVLLGFAVQVARTMRPRGLWFNKLLLGTFTAGIVVQGADIWNSSVPYADWPVAVILVSLAASIVRWRKVLMGFVRCKFGEPPAPGAAPNPGRRAEDIERLEHPQLNRAVGGRKQ